MTSHRYSALGSALAVALATAAFACSTTSSPDESSEQEIKAAAGNDPAPGNDAATSPTCCDPAARPQGNLEGAYCCADSAWHPSPGGGERSTCSPFGGTGQVCEVCGGPPITAYCAECPGGFNGYKQIDGVPTCQCCSSAADAGGL